jgi:hypothetical protein
MEGNSTPTEKLLNLSENIDKYSIEGAKKSIKELLTAGANINGTMIDDMNLYTPLFRLCEQGAPPSIIQFILEMGADPNQKAGYNAEWTALSYLTNDNHMPYLFYIRDSSVKVKEESDNYKHIVIQILINTPSLDPNVLDAAGTLCFHLFSGFPDLLYDFIVIRHPSIANLNYLNGDSKRTLLILCCRAIKILKERLRGSERNISFYQTIHKMQLDAKIVDLLCRIDGIDMNVIDTENKTALDYIRNALPGIRILENQRNKNHPTGILTYLEQLLVNRHAYTYDELQLQKTPVIRRKLGNMGGGKRKTKKSKTNRVNSGRTRIQPQSCDSR